MKKVTLVSVIVLLTGTLLGQSLQKGNLVGVHLSTINLNQGVTMNQYMDFFANSVIPELEKNYSEKVFITKCVRGENVNSLGFIIIFESEKMRDRLYNADGSLSVVGKAANEKMQPTMDKLNKLGTISSKYSDWVIQ